MWKERGIRGIAMLVALFFLIAFLAMPTVLTSKSDNRAGSDITEAKSCLAGDWTPKNHTETQGGFGEAVVGTGNNIYVIRSHSTGSSYFGEYDPSNDCWTTLKKWGDLSDSDLPRPKSGTALAWDSNTYIYVMFGGAQRDNNRKYFYRYNITDNSWAPLTDTPYPQGAGNAITWSGYDNKIYAIMGSNERKKSYFACYNPFSKSWENLNLTWIVTDDGAALVWAGGTYLYALQGEVGEDENQPITNFSRYNISTNSSGTWEDMHSIPEIEGVGDGASLLWIGNWMDDYANYIFALGGGSGLTGEPPGEETPGNNSYTYCISEDEWNELESIPCPIGEYVGNRLGFARGNIYYWQGTPTSEKWICGGKAFLMFEINTPPEITYYAPESPVNDYVGASRSFNITINQIVDVRWQINGTEVQTNASVTEASYMNTSAVNGIWNVSAIVCNANSTDMQTWDWRVTSPCFIATAAYGTALHEDIEVLRDFRYAYLTSNPAGRAFVKIYYDANPPLADVIRDNERL